MPPLLVQLGQEELILDQGRQLATRAKDAGVEVHLEEFPGMFHDFQAMASLIPEAERAIEELGTFLAQRIDG